MKKIKAISFLYFILLGVNANALTLNESISIALDKNLDIKSSQYNYLKNIENLKSNKSKFLPQLNVGYNYMNTNEPIFNNKQSENSSLSASLSYNLFNGFKDLANKKSSKFLLKSSKYLLQAKKQDIILDVKTAYIKYLNSKNELETYESAYKLFQKQFNDSKNRFEQGLIAKNDLLQVQVNTSNAKQNIVMAKGNLKVAKFNLSNILGGKNLDNENIENIKSELFLKEYNKEDIYNRSEIEALKMNIKSFEQKKEVSKSGFYPKVDASVSHNKYYDTFSFKRYESDIDKQNIARLTATWNLFNGGETNALLNSAKIDYKNAKNELEKIKLAIKLQYENAKSNLEVAIDNLETSKLSLTQAKENYQIVKNRFDEGLSSNTDLTDANYLLTQAQQRYSNAFYNKFLAIATLDRIVEIKKF